MIEYSVYHKGMFKDMPLFNKKELFGTYDIETSKIELNKQPHAIMYIWQACIGDFNKRKCVIGRTWKECVDFFTELPDFYGFDDKNPFRLYVHNLAYEFQFLRSVFKISDVFALKKRVPVSCVLNYNVKMLCSYKLTNMSLAKFLKSENVAQQKLTMDYSIQRFADTVMSENDMDYSLADVLGLHQALSNLMIKENDSVKTIPLTSTGYVRREARQVMAENPNNRKVFLDSQLDKHTYCLCKAMSRGGNTHYNFIYSGEIIKNVKSMDRSSSYPAVMCGNYKYPTGRYYYERKNSVIDGCSNIMHIVMHDIKFKRGVYMPYMAVGKCQHYSRKNCIQDNGRILQCDYAEMVINEIDFEIISKQYSWSRIDWIDHYVADMDYLPKDYRSFVYNMYVAKCKLKHGDAYFYNKFKNKVNALFGMMLTDITRENIIYQNDDWGSELSDIRDDLKRYYNSKKSFLTYQHGAYVTAWARHELQRAIDKVGIDSVYVDTDSLKYIDNHDVDFETLNSDIRANNAMMGVMPVEVGKEVFELGVWEVDAVYKQFVSYGAKKYAYQYDNGKYGVTVAGLNKQKATDYINKVGLKEFHPDKVFHEDISGRLTPVYNDAIQWREIEYEGHKVELTSNMCLIPTTYTLNITKDYKDILEGEVWL